MQPSCDMLHYPLFHLQVPVEAEEVQYCNLPKAIPASGIAHVKIDFVADVCNKQQHKVVLTSGISNSSTSYHAHAPIP